MAGLEPVPVETIRPGDLVDVHAHVGVKVVAAVNRYDDDGAIVVTYFTHGVETYENKARDRGRRNVVQGVAYRSLRPLRAGDLLNVERGRPETAARLQAELEGAELERFEQAADRAARGRRHADKNRT